MSSGAWGAVEREAQERSARVLVVASDRERGRATAEWLPRGGGGPLWLATDRCAAVEAARVHQPEVAVVELGFRGCEGPAVALQLRLAARHLEPIFFAAPGEQGEVAAARDLGLARVVAFDDLFVSLERVLVPLAECVRLRRRLEAAERLVRQRTLEEQSRLEGGRITLPEAERRYRETYIRSLLAETGNRREAARRAGVPYTTLCEIIRKLGIEGA